MSSEAIVALVLGVPSLVGAYAWFYKRRPERNDITITSADKVVQMSLGFASKANATNDELEAKVDRLEAELTQYKLDAEARHAELITELRAKKAEVKHLEGEVERRDAAIESRDTQIRELTGRVKKLEGEVETLKANGSS